MNRQPDFRQILDMIPGGVLVFRIDDQARIVPVFVNQGLEQMFGCQSRELLVSTDHLLQKIHPDDRLSLTRRLSLASHDQTPFELQFRLCPEVGERIISMVVRPDPDRHLHWYGLLQDLTEQHRDQAKQRLLASVFDASLEGMVITDHEQRILEVNPAFTHLTGYSRHEVIGKTPDFMDSDHHGPEFYEAMDRQIQERGYWQGELWNKCRNGDLLPELLSISTLYGPDGQPQHYIGVFSDIRELKQKQNELNWIANHDPLTNIPNRRLFHQRLSQACAQSRRDKTPLALCMLDLDGFKPVNDLWGHDAGDALLIEIARRLQHSVRADEIVARLGGDEFVMFFRSPEGQRVFNRIREVIARPVTLPGGMETRVTASMGVAWFVSEDAVDETTLLQRADEALYQSKLNGRDCVTEWNQQT